MHLFLEKRPRPTKYRHRVDICLEVWMAFTCLFSQYLFHIHPFGLFSCRLHSIYTLLSIHFKFMRWTYRIVSNEQMLKRMKQACTSVVSLFSQFSHSSQFVFVSQISKRDHCTTAIYSQSRIELIRGNLCKRWLVCAASFFFHLLLFSYSVLEDFQWDSKRHAASTKPIKSWMCVDRALRECHTFCETYSTSISK